MKLKRFQRLFYALANLAAGHGMEFSLELRDFDSESRAMNGFLTNSTTRDNGLILRAWWPEGADQNGGDTEMVAGGDDEVDEADG